MYKNIAISLLSGITCYCGKQIKQNIKKLHKNKDFILEPFNNDYKLKKLIINDDLLYSNNILNQNIEECQDLLEKYCKEKQVFVYHNAKKSNNNKNILKQQINKLVKEQQLSLTSKNNVKDVINFIDTQNNQYKMRQSEDLVNFLKHNKIRQEVLEEKFLLICGENKNNIDCVISQQLNKINKDYKLVNIFQ